MRAFKSGTDRGFSRLSDRVGVVANLSLLDALYVQTATSGSYAFPAGTVLVEIIALGAGGVPRSSTAGAGAGSVEYRYAPPSQGMGLTYTTGSVGNNVIESTSTTVSLPGSGLADIVANAGTRTAGSGSGPAGSIIRLGGNPGNPGQGPFGGEGGGSGTAVGGGGAGPIGGCGGRPERPQAGIGGGADVNNITAGPGALSIKCYGVAA